MLKGLREGESGHCSYLPLPPVLGADFRHPTASEGGAFPPFTPYSITSRRSLPLPTLTRVASSSRALRSTTMQP